MSDLLTVNEAAALLGYDASFVRRLLETGKLPGQRFGWMWQIERAAVEAWQASHAGQMKRGRRTMTMPMREYTLMSTGGNPETQAHPIGSTFTVVGLAEGWPSGCDQYSLLWEKSRLPWALPAPQGEPERWCQADNARGDQYATLVSSRVLTDDEALRHQSIARWLTRTVPQK